MRTLVTCDQARELDAATRRALEVTSIQLMEKASLRLWDALRKRIGELPALSEKGSGLKIAALCGHGDNGGDALAMLRHAYSAGFANLAAVVSARGAGETAQAQARSLSAAGIPILRWSEDAGPRDLLESADLVLDGILGTGARGAAAGEAAEMIQALNRLGNGGVAASCRAFRPHIASVDLPSGLGDAWSEGMPRVQADSTLSLEPAKAICLTPEGRQACGALVSVGDVFPEALVSGKSAIGTIGAIGTLEPADLDRLAPIVGDSSYKTSRGRLAIFAGSEGTLGAAQLCARGALASGAGYITLYVDDALYPLAAPALESVIVKPLSGLGGIPACDAILVGPGWGRGAGRERLLSAILGSGTPAILDADAIRLLAARPELASAAKAPCALTPHPGEFSALAKAFRSGGEEGSPFLQSLGGVCEATGMLTLYKSSLSWIASPGGSFAVWEGLTPELGTAGSGDVLAGLFAGSAAVSLAARSAASLAKGAEKRGELAAQGVGEALRGAAFCAVVAHGLAGRRLARGKGWFGAADLTSECALLMREVSRREAPPPDNRRRT
jgi:NAD(P)H-hydrate epimerase